jgi:carboxypeptidase Taq
MGYTNEVGVVGETIHPFTNGINSCDVRTTTRYDESLLFSNLYSVMHEVGHATYELQNNSEFSATALMGGASCALHESQSRFYENYLGRSREFIEFLYPILKEVYPSQMEKYTLDDIYYYCNDVSNQFTRTEADELTYPFHIIIRYKIEKELFHNELTVDRISDRFNELFMEYFGVKPKNKLEGCYQDVHWSSGFGYFPTYALGSAMSAQFLVSMEKDFNPFLDMKNGDFKRVNAWLREHVHKYGKSKKNLEVLKIATGEDFNPRYYIDYLKNKFKKIYNI